MFEHRTSPLLPRRQFLRRLLRSAGVGWLVILSGLMLGMAGYRVFNGESWTDAFVDAAMILSGMGQVSPLQSAAAKIFAGAYALFSGLLFISVATILVSPILHRMLHRLHLEDAQREREPSKT